MCFGVGVSRIELVFVEGTTKANDNLIADNNIKSGAIESFHFLHDLAYDNVLVFECLHKRRDAICAQLRRFDAKGQIEWQIMFVVGQEFDERKLESVEKWNFLFSTSAFQVFKNLE